MKQLFLSAFIATTLSISCSSDDHDSTDQHTISPAQVNMNYDKTEQLTAKIGSSSIVATDFTWTSSDEKRGKVTPTGLVVAQKVGSFTVSANRNGKTATSTITVVPYQNIFKEPVMGFGQTKNQIKDAETRTLQSETSTSLLYQGENGNVMNVGYIFDSSGKMTSAGVQFPNSSASIDKVTTFYKERYQIINSTSMPIIFKHLDEPIFIGLSVSTSSQVIATYTKQ